MSCGCGQAVGRPGTRSRLFPMVVAGADAVNRGVAAGGGRPLWWLPLLALAGVGVLIAMGGKKKRRR